ncbi:MAG: hypothetical protein ABEI77_05640 [Halorientalis sp.]
MKAGVLGIVDDSFEVVDSFTETITEGDHELGRCLVIDRVFSTPDGEMAFAGRAAAETLVTDTDARIEDGEIHVTDRDRTVTRHTEFVGIPGEFVVVGSGNGTFAFDLIAEDTNTTIERTTLDLDQFFESHESATPWRAGFYSTDESAVSGTFHGDDLRATHDLETHLQNSNLNQIGLSYSYDDGALEVKMTASRSGYVEVYRPTEFDSGHYLAYLQDEIVPHVR